MAHKPALDASQAFDAFPEVLRELGIEIPAEALIPLRAHFELLLRWNAKMNLSSVRDPMQILRRHFAESLFATRVVKLKGMLYDVGSGAGFPGLPLKAARPEIKLVLVESSQKKAAFLKEVVRAGGFQGVRVETERVERLPEQAELELADWITMRAVGHIGEMLPVFRHLLVPRGQVLLFLGETDAEQARGETEGFTWQEAVRVPGSERRVILAGQKLAA